MQFDVQELDPSVRLHDAVRGNVIADLGDVGAGKRPTNSARHLRLGGACLALAPGTPFTLDLFSIPGRCRAAVQARANVLTQLLQSCRSQPVLLLHEPQGLANDLAGRAVEPGIDLLPHHLLELRGEIDVHTHAEFLALQAARADGYGINYCQRWTLRETVASRPIDRNCHGAPCAAISCDEEGVERVLKELEHMGYEYVVCDSPAGIETGAVMALRFADEALVVTNPEVSSARDSDRILGILQAKSKRAELSQDAVKEHLLLTRYSPKRVDEGEMLSYKDVQEILRIPLIGVIPESEAVLHGSNQGTPAIHLKDSDVAEAYMDMVARFLGEPIPMRFVDYEKPGLLKRLFGGR